MNKLTVMSSILLTSACLVAGLNVANAADAASSTSSSATKGTAATATASTTPATSTSAGQPMTSTDAQQNKMFEDKLQKMKTDLSLTDAQTGKMRTIMENARKDMKAIHEQFKALSDKMSADIKGVLSPEQYQKFEDMRQQEEAKRQKDWQAANKG